MLDTLHIIPTSSGISLHRIIQLDAPPPIERLINAVGGPIKLIPGFDSILRQGEIKPCLAFFSQVQRSNQEQNTWANLLWLQALVRKYGFSEAKTPLTITGLVAVVWGDTLLLKNLDPLVAFLNQEEQR